MEPSCDPSERESLLLPESLLLLFPLLLLSLLALLLAGQRELPELVEPHQELVCVVPPRSSDPSPSLLPVSSNQWTVVIRKWSVSGKSRRFKRVHDKRGRSRLYVIRDIR